MSPLGVVAALLDERSIVRLASAPRPAPARAAQSLLVLPRFCQGQIAMTGVDRDRDVADEVGDVDEPAGHADDRAVAAVGDRPDGAADGGCAVAPLGAELGVVVGGVEQLERLLADGCERSMLGLLGRTRGVRRAALD